MLGIVYVLAALTLAGSVSRSAAAAPWARPAIVSVEVFVIVVQLVRAFDLSVSTAIYVALFVAIVALLFVPDGQRALGDVGRSLIPPRDRVSYTAAMAGGRATRALGAPQQPSELPSGLRTTRVIAYVQGGLGLLNGGLLIFGGAAFATALNLQGAGGAALIIAIGVIVVAVSGLLIWGGRLLGNLSRRARYGVLAYEYASIVLGLLSLADPLQAGIRVILAAIAIYYLQFDAETKAAFARPAGLTEEEPWPAPHRHPLRARRRAGTRRRATHRPPPRRCRSTRCPYVPAGPVPGLQYAGFWIRFASYLIDVIPIAILGGILNVSLGTGYSCGFDANNVYHCGGGSGSIGSWLAVLVLGVYWVLTWSLLGASLGQKALGMRVVNAQNGERIDVGKAVLRYVGFVISAIPLALGLIWAGFDPRKQGWHDKIAGTYVVRPRLAQSAARRFSSR